MSVEFCSKVPNLGVVSPQGQREEMHAVLFHLVTAGIEKTSPGNESVT